MKEPYKQNFKIASKYTLRKRPAGELSVCGSCTKTVTLEKAIVLLQEVVYYNIP